MSVDEYVELLRSDPRTSDVGGTRYDTVVSMEAKTRKAYRVKPPVTARTSFSCGDRGSR